MNYLILMMVTAFSLTVNKPTIPEKFDIGNNYFVYFQEEETPQESIPSESTTEETTESTCDEDCNDPNHIHYDICFEVDLSKPKKTVYNMTNAEMDKLSIKQKAKLVGISVKEFKMMTEVISHEAGLKMNDKICVAAVIWNRKYCKQFPNSIKKVIDQPGQFYDLSKDRSGKASDKKAQLAILIAYKKVHNFEIPHNVLYFNCIGFGSKNRNRYKKYKHYNNYFLKDTYCKCDWCKAKPKPTPEVVNTLDILEKVAGES